MAKWQRFVLGAKGSRFRLELINGSRLARCSFGLAESKLGSRLVLNWLRAKNKSAKFVTEGRVSPKTWYRMRWGSNGSARGFEVR